MTAPALSPEEYDRVRVFGLDQPEPVADDSEGMREGAEAIGVIVLIVVVLAVIVGLCILAEHLPWVNR